MFESHRGDASSEDHDEGGGGEGPALMDFGEDLAVEVGDFVFESVGKIVDGETVLG